MSDDSLYRSGGHWSDQLSVTHLLWWAFGVTVLALVFIEINSEVQGRIFWHLLTVHDQPAAWLMLVTLALGYWLQKGGNDAGDTGDWVERWVLAIDHRRYEIALSLWILLCLGSVFVYRNHPLAMDEYAVVFQAKIFAAGAMHGQFPPDLLDLAIPRGFQNEFLMVNRTTGAVASAYWPGFSLLLTPFMALGIPWACNPTLVAASFLLIGRVARDVLGSPLAAGWAMLFALASPTFIANGMTYYSMSAHLLLNLGFACLLIAPSPIRLYLAGLVGGFALALHNPFPHSVFAAPWLVWLVIRPGRQFVDWVWLVAGYLTLGLPLVIGWPLWQRALFQPVLAVAESASTYADTGFSLGLVDRAMEFMLGFFRVIQWPAEMTIMARLGGLAKLWLWASPLLLLLAWRGARRGTLTSVRLMGASALVTFFAYFLIRFDQGHGWGYRYFHSAWGVLPVLAAMGAIKYAKQEGVRAARVIFLLVVISLVSANALRLSQMGDFVAEHLAHFPPRSQEERQLVMHNGRGYYAFDLIQNDPWLAGREQVFLIMKQADIALLLARFPGSYERQANRFGETYIAHEPPSGER